MKKLQVSFNLLGAAAILAIATEALFELLSLVINAPYAVEKLLLALTVSSTVGAALAALTVRRRLSPRLKLAVLSIGVNYCILYFTTGIANNLFERILIAWLAAALVCFSSYFALRAPSRQWNLVVFLLIIQVGISLLLLAVTNIYRTQQLHQLWIESKQRLTV